MVANRIFLSTLLTLGLSITAVGAASAQTYPNRPIRLIVPLPPGGTIDTVGRLIAQHLSDSLGQTVIVDNRPGGGTTIGLKAVAAAEPDGYTILVGSTGSLAINPALYKNLDFASVRSLTPVAMLVSLPNMLAVSTTVPAKTVGELIAYAKADPGKLSHGSALGTPPHLLGEFFKIKAGIDVLYVPYKGTAAAIADLLGGQIQITSENPGLLAPYIQDGKMRPMLVTSTSRLPGLPDVPTLSELGFDGYPTVSWVGIMAPGGTPQAIVNRLNAAINDILKSAAMRASLMRLGFDAQIMSQEEFAAWIAGDEAKWAEVVKLTGAVGE
jgi:tripartite-type tricarboxylate transporter receptor subunit TctC